MEDENLSDIANDATVNVVDNAEKEMLQGEEPETDQPGPAEADDVHAGGQVENVEQGDDVGLEGEQSADNVEVEPVEPGTAVDIEGEPEQTEEGNALDEEAEAELENEEEVDTVADALADPEPETEAVSVEAEPEPELETEEQAELEANEAEVIVEDGAQEAQAETEAQAGLEAEVQEADAEVQEPEPEPEVQEAEAEPEPKVVEVEAEPKVQEEEEEEAEPEAQEPDIVPAHEAEEYAAATKPNGEEASAAVVDAEEEAEADVELEETDANVEDPSAQESGAAEEQAEVVEMVREDQQVSAEARIAQIDVPSSCAQQEQDASHEVFEQDNEEVGEDSEEMEENNKFKDAKTDDQSGMAATIAVAAGIAAVGVAVAVAAGGAETETEVTTTCDGDSSATAATEVDRKPHDGDDSEDTVSVSTGGGTASGNSPTTGLDEIDESITTTKAAADVDDDSNRMSMRKKFTPMTARMTELGSVACGPGVSWVVTTGMAVVALSYSWWLKVLGVVCRLLDLCTVKALKQGDLDMTIFATSENTQGGICACCSTGNNNGESNNNNSTDMETSPWFANELVSSAVDVPNAPGNNNEGPITTTSTTDIMGSITDWTVRPTAAVDNTALNNGREEEQRTPGMLFMPAMVLPSSTYAYDSWMHMAGCVTATGKRYAIFKFRADLVYRAPTNHLKAAIRQARVSCTLVKQRALTLSQGDGVKFKRAFEPVVMMLDTILSASEDEMLWMLRTLALQAVNPSSSPSSTTENKSNSGLTMALQWLEFEHRLLRSSVKPHNASGFFRTREAALATYMLFAQTGGGGRKEMTLMKNMVKLLHMGNNDNLLDVIQYIVRESPRKLHDAVLSVLAVLTVQRCARQWVLMECESDSMIVSGVYPVNLARALMTDIEDDDNNTTATATTQQKSHKKNKTTSITDWPKLRMEPYKHKYDSNGVSFTNAVIQHSALYSKLHVISSAWDIGLLARVDWAMRYGRRYVRAEDVMRVRAAATGMRNGEGGGGMVGVVDLSGMDARALLALVIGAVIRVAGQHDTIFRLMEWYPMMASRGPDDTANGVTSMGNGKENESGAGIMNNKDMNHHHHHHHMMAFGSYYGTFGRDELTLGSSDQQRQQKEKVSDDGILGMESQHDDGPWDVYAALPQVRVQDVVDLGLVTCVRTNRYVFNDVPGNEHVKLRVVGGGGSERLVLGSRADKRARHVAFEAGADQLFD